jgi:hypothetical protein
LLALGGEFLRTLVLFLAQRLFARDSFGRHLIQREVTLADDFGNLALRIADFYGPAALAGKCDGRRVVGARGADREQRCQEQYEITCH